MKSQHRANERVRGQQLQTCYVIITKICGFLFFLIDLSLANDTLQFFTLGFKCVILPQTFASLNPSKLYFSLIFFFLQSLFFLNMHIFYWSIVDLQCFTCTARWFSYTTYMDIYIYIITYMYIIFQIIFHYRLLQDIDSSSLCYMVNLCCLLHIYFLKLEI